MENQESGILEAVSHLKEDTLLRFRVGPFRFSVPAVEVEGIIVPPRLTVIPLNPPHSKGVFLYHEHLASAISLRSKFGLPDHNDDNLGQLILGQVNTGLVGFWVDEVYETVDSTELEWRSMPEFVPHAAFETFAVKDDEIVMATTMQKLYDVPAEEMASMLASVRQNFDLPDDVPPVEAEGLAAGSGADDEDVFGDLVDSSNEPSSTEDAGGLANPSEDSAVAGEANASDASAGEAGLGEKRSTVVDFPGTHEAGSSSKTPGSAGDRLRGSAPVTGNPDTPDSKTRREQVTARAGTGPRATGHGSHSAARTTSQSRASNIHSRVNPSHASPEHRPGRAESYSGGTYAGSINRFRQENSSAAYSPDDAIAGKQDEKHSGNGIGWLLLALLLLLLVVGYWLWPTSQNDGFVPRQAATDTLPAPQQSGPLAYSSSSSRSDSVTATQVDRQSDRVADNAATRSEDNEVYRLEGKDVTVTVERNQPEQPQPRTEPVQKQAEAVSNESKPQPGYHEFVHIVVKGDTLWDIAKKYLKNPFRYPELARLSEIKNPDLIYPGDTVRIRARDE